VRAAPRGAHKFVNERRVFGRDAFETRSRVCPGLRARQGLPSAPSTRSISSLMRTSGRRSHPVPARPGGRPRADACPFSQRRQRQKYTVPGARLHNPPGASPLQGSRSGGRSSAIAAASESRDAPPMMIILVSGGCGSGHGRGRRMTVSARNAHPWRTFPLEVRGMSATRSERGRHLLVESRRCCVRAWTTRDRTGEPSTPSATADGSPTTGTSSHFGRRRVSSQKVPSSLDLVADIPLTQRKGAPTDERSGRRQSFSGRGRARNRSRR